MLFKVNGQIEEVEQNLKNKFRVLKLWGRQGFDGEHRDLCKAYGRSGITLKTGKKINADYTETNLAVAV